MSDWAARVESELKHRRKQDVEFSNAAAATENRLAADRAESDAVLMPMIEGMFNVLLDRCEPDAQEVFMDTAAFVPGVSVLRFGRLGWLLDYGTILTDDGALSTCSTDASGFTFKYELRKGEVLRRLLNRLPSRVAHACRNLERIRGAGRLYDYDDKRRLGLSNLQLGYLIDENGKLVYLEHQSPAAGSDGWEPPVPAEDRLLKLTTDYLRERGC